MTFVEALSKLAEKRYIIRRDSWETGNYLTTDKEDGNLIVVNIFGEEPIDFSEATSDDINATDWVIDVVKDTMGIAELDIEDPSLIIDGQKYMLDEDAINDTIEVFETYQNLMFLKARHDLINDFDDLESEFD
jgi:hypothetical protein